jgi:histidinol-phosphatase (PHP family)
MVIEKTSYHTHTTISDGKLSPEELIKLSIKMGFKVLAITDHYMRTDDVARSGWGMDLYSDEDFENLVKLKKKYSGKIKILIGVEFDWLPTKKKWLLGETRRRGYDIKILSYHLMPINGRYYCVNAEEKDFKEVLDLFEGNVKKLIMFYYEGLRDGIKTGWFDVVGHMDIIKSFNKDSKYFSENEDWYRKEILETLVLVKKFNLKLDVNIKGRKLPVGEQFPSKWIIKEAKKMGIELLIGTDAHRSKELDYNLNDIEDLING